MSVCMHLPSPCDIPQKNKTTTTFFLNVKNTEYPMGGIATTEILSKYRWSKESTPLS